MFNILQYPFNICSGKGKRAAGACASSPLSVVRQSVNNGTAVLGQARKRHLVDRRRRFLARWRLVEKSEGVAIDDLLILACATLSAHGISSCKRSTVLGHNSRTYENFATT
ncbi:MAG: hypothetical protein EXS55_01305 [Candidatus Magasanikbacteria bacterium]|nr:hypothetical protein [Candidatus Magasanikbacteria bacterium]